MNTKILSENKITPTFENRVDSNELKQAGQDPHCFLST